MITTSSEGKQPILSDHRHFSQLPTGADRDTFEQLKESPPSAETHPNLFAWFYLIFKFSESIRNSWGGASAGAAKGGDKKAAAPKTEAKKEEKPKDDDDVDLFGDDDNEEDAAVSLIFNSESILKYNIGS